jgi:hypothetical protein
MFIQPHATDNFPCNSEPVNPIGMFVESKVKCDDGVNIATRAVSLPDGHASVSLVFHAKRLAIRSGLNKSLLLSLQLCYSRNAAL